MRTSAQVFSGLGFLALLAPASAQFSNTTTSSPPFGNSTASATSSAPASATPFANSTAPFFLSVQAAPGLKKRQVTAGTPYLSLVGGQLIATEACTTSPPVAFSIVAGSLRIADSFASVTAATVTAPGFSPLQFATTAAATDIETVFAIDAAGGLTWANAAFLDGEAEFCLLDNVLQAAYSVPVASIAGCIPVVPTRSLSVCPTSSTTNIIIGVEITIQITLNNVINVINGVTVTSTSTATQTITSPLTATPATYVNGNGTVTSTVACAQCLCPGYVSGQLTVYQTQSVCPVCVASTVTPVVATVVPCATCPALVPGAPAAQTVGGNPYTALVPAAPGQATPYVTVPAVSGQPTAPVTYTGGAATMSAKGAVFGLLAGLVLSLC